jgi:hypothetical protein
MRNNIGLSERFTYLGVASSGPCLLPYARNVWFEEGGFFMVHGGALSIWHDSWMLQPFRTMYRMY